ncbi:MAG: hypothetical protein EA359_17625 [Balneolaceae bacterium]|nr:MAG: hypothetical protein EA359_17625 [Balneolaceae bacterium]
MAAVMDLNGNGGNIAIPNPGETIETGFQPWNQLHGEYNISVLNDDVTNIIRLQATGRFENSVYIAAVGLVPGAGGGGFPWPPFDSAVHAEEDLIVNSGTVNGDIYSGQKLTITGNAQIHGNVVAVADDIPVTIEMNSGKVWGSVYTNAVNPASIKYTNWSAEITGNLYVGQGGNPAIVAPPISQWHPGHVKGSSASISSPIPPQNMPLPEFPEIPQNQTILPAIHLSGVGFQLLDLTGGDAYVPTIDVHNSTHLTVNVGSHDRILRVNNFNMTQGHLNIISQGDGRLQLIVENTFNIGGSSSMNNNINLDGNSQSPLGLLFAYAGSQKLTIGGNIPINANIFIKDADLQLGNSGQINGNIITGGSNVNIDGGSGNNSRVVYAPNAHVTMGGSGTVNGSIVAKSFSGSGGYLVNYTDEFMDTLPDLNSGGGGGNITNYSIAYWN